MTYLDNILPYTLIFFFCYFFSVGSDSDVTEMIKHYLKEIEELRVKLLESEATCKQLRKQSQIRASLSPRAAMTGHFDQTFGLESDANGLIQEAKRDLRKDLEILSTKGRPPAPAVKTLESGKEGNEGQLVEAPDFESDDDGKSLIAPSYHFSFTSMRCHLSKLCY